MSDVSGEERLARAALTCVAEPGDPVMGALLRSCAPAEIVTALVQGRAPVRPCRSRWGSRTGPGTRAAGTGAGAAPVAGRLGEAPAEPALDAWRREGIRLVCPGDAEWPSQLDVLGDARPWGVWVRGSGDLRYACLRSVSIVGTRSATAYGSYVCTEMAADVGRTRDGRSSPGARSASTAARTGPRSPPMGSTVAVLACGVDHDYPRATTGSSGHPRAAARRSASGRRAACPPVPGSWSATG